MDRNAVKILLVEDDPFISNMYDTKFRMEGYNIVVCKTGEDALSCLERDESLPAIILLDILLPGMDGFSVLRKLKRHPKAKDVPVVMLTNLGQKDDVRRGLEGGAVGYLIKAHYMPSEVVEKIKYALQTGTLHDGAVVQ